MTSSTPAMPSAASLMAAPFKATAQSAPAAPQVPAPQKPKDADKKAGLVLKDWIEAAKRNRKRFLAQFYEIRRYAYAEDHNFQYQNMPNWFRAKVALTGEALKVFGPLLLQENPDRTVTPRDWDTPPQKARTELMQTVLNFTPEKHDLAGENREVIEDYIVGGRGVSWTGMDDTTGLPRTVFDSIENLLVDPNAVRWRDVKVVARRRRMTRFDAAALIPSAKDIIAKLPANAMRNSDTGVKNPMVTERDAGSECIYFYEIFSLVGLHQFKGGTEWLKATQPGVDQFDADNSPKKWFIGEDGTFLAETSWDVPLFKNPVDPFPCTVLDFQHHPDDIWTVSVLSDGIGYQRAINWVMTMLLGKVKITSRTVLALLKQNGTGLTAKQKDKVLIGEDLEVLEIEVKGDKMKLGDFLQQFDWSQDYVPALMQLMEMLESKYRMATGLYSILSTGQGDTQDRSAAATQMKDRNSRSRIEDMREQIAKHGAAVAKKEAITARFLVTKETIAKYFGTDEAEKWGFFASPDKMSAGYFMQYLVKAGMPEEEAAAQATELAAQAVPLDEILDSDFGIEVASARRKDIDQQIDVLTQMNNQSNPTLLQSQDPAAQGMAYMNMAALYKLMGAPKELVDAFQQQADKLRAPPPPPPPPVLNSPTGEPPGVPSAPGAGAPPVDPPGLPSTAPGLPPPTPPGL